MVAVRAYRVGDRDAVRRICHETGFMGEPVDWFWRDFESFADLWTAYYTDEEPESVFVAVDHDRVVGYVTGCVDSSRAPSVRQAIGRHLFRRLIMYRPGTAGFFWRSMVDIVRDRGVREPVLADPRWPSHLHINLLTASRGQGAGAALMSALFSHLRASGSPGCHLSTLRENESAIAFFEAVGFVCHGEPIRIPGMRTRAGLRMSAQLMTKSFASCG